MITWFERVQNLRKELGREPTLFELIEEAKKHIMTPEERQAQAESLAQANVSTGDQRFD